MLNDTLNTCLYRVVQRPLGMHILTASSVT